MRARVMGAAAVIAIAGLGAFAAIGLGGQGAGTTTRILKQSRTTQRLQVHEAGRPSGGASSATAAKPKKTKIRYFESDPQTTDPGENGHTGGTLPCPKDTKVLGGYLASDAPGVTLDYSALGSNVRKWGLDAYNTDDGPHVVTFGVVCAENVR